MRVEVRPEPFDPWQTLAEYTRWRPQLHGRYGATAVFVGSMRDFNEGSDVQAMTLEHYPGMTERELENITRDACQRWSLVDALVIHRVGLLQPHDPIVLVAVWSAHRAEAYAANRHIMETLKHSAPFWKRETLGDGTTRWVETNTAG